MCLYYTGRHKLLLPHHECLACFQAAGEWAALAYEDQNEEQLAADLQQKLNAVSVAA